MDTTIQFLIHYGYAVLAAWVFAEQFGFPISSIPLLLAGGALAGTGDLNLVLVVVLTVAGSLVADSIWFEIGRLKGSGVLNVLCRISLEQDSCVRKTQNLYARWGPNALVVAKFIPGFSIVAPPMAGTFGMRTGRFLLFDGAGAFAYIGTFVALGYAFSHQLKSIAEIALGFGMWLLVLLAAGVILYLAWKYFQRQRFLRRLRISRITPEELKQKIDDGEEITIVDLRLAIDFESDPNTIPGAVVMPSEEFDQRYAEIPAARELVLFCTCPNEATSAHVALMLKRRGLTHVRPLAGGLAGWKKKGFPLEARKVPQQAEDKRLMEAS